jgi:hypothetical protein
VHVETQFSGFVPLNDCANHLLPALQASIMENNHARKPTEDFEQFPEPKIKSIEVHIRRNETTGNILLILFDV